MKKIRQEDGKEAEGSLDELTTTTSRPANASYVIVSPVCNEIGHLDRLIDSVARQTLLPALWIIVDDGSTDGTTEALRRRSASLPWIKVINRPVKSRVALEGGEDWAAMQDGFPQLAGIAYEYISKLDGDIVLEPDYFEQLVGYLERDVGLGMVSGSCWETYNGRSAALRTIVGSSWPPARLYRKNCFEQVSTHGPVLGWDMLHVIRARAMGWEVEAYEAPRFFHLRTMGSRGGVLRGKLRYGRTSYLLGYSRIYFALRLVYQMVQYPLLLGSVEMLRGYVKARRGKEPLIVTAQDKAEMHRMQRRGVFPRLWSRKYTALGYVKCAAPKRTADIDPENLRTLKGEK